MEQLFVNIIKQGDNLFWGDIIIWLLIILGAYFSIRLAFLQVRYVKHAFLLMLEVPGKKHHISPFMAMTISSAARVGTGNLAGVSMAISLGGPGALVWMWLLAIVGSASSFVENTLAQAYKIKAKDGSFFGGPAYYMEQGLNARWMGIIFSILITVSYGLIFVSVQSNTIQAAMQGQFGISQDTMAIILVLMVVPLVFGGANRIAHFTKFLFPIMAGAYLLLSVYIVLFHFMDFPKVISIMFQDAFGLQQFTGATFGYMMMTGIKRAMFASEAGMGSAPNASATAHISHPVKQGFVQLFGVFIDIFFICTATGFIILFTHADGNIPHTFDGIVLLENSVSSVVGPLGGEFIAVALFLFAWGCIIGDYFYGANNLKFITNNKLVLHIFRILCIGMVVFGVYTSIEIAWTLADIFMGLMVVLNMVAIFLLFKVVRKLYADYVGQLRQGKNPVFHKNFIPELKNVDYWDDNHVNEFKDANEDIDQNYRLEEKKRLERERLHKS